ncbi:MAG TPA: FAD/NAD(P)-binding oxidoreductase [Chloroflexota bacterium]|nr:FAD/NAD(P)-binding oxidoreductase [Chloroflexota bacterium]
MVEPASFDVLVIGAGPAGLAAACVAAESGQRVGVVDDNFSPGGQIWRGQAVSKEKTPWLGRIIGKTGIRPTVDSLASYWLERTAKSDLAWYPSTRIVTAPGPNRLLGENADGAVSLAYQKLILATGARELFLPFPGWTLPNVMGAGGLQAMAKGGMPIVGKRVVVAGTGPLLLVVAAYLRQHGAIVPVVAEQAAAWSLTQFGAGLSREPGKLAQAFALRAQLRGVPFLTYTWPTAVTADGEGLRVTLRQRGQSRDIACDYLACGFGLVPNLELPCLLGCGIIEGAVLVDDWQETTVTGVYCVGEPTGVGGVDKAVLEGQVAGYAASGQRDRAESLFGKRDAAQRFVGHLKRTFALQPELRQLPTPETLVCRCEDVTYGRLHGYASWRAAKLHTRCGMGPCQGRICGAALHALFDWEDDSARPPVFPATLATLARGLDTERIE